MPRKNYIQIKASDKEKASWIAQAYLENKTLSDFIRDKINSSILEDNLERLEAAVKRHDEILMNELTKI
jgi:phosphoribosyl-ATP pyrophosphohydrolase